MPAQVLLVYFCGKALGKEESECSMILMISLAADYHIILMFFFLFCCRRIARSVPKQIGGEAQL